MKRATDTVGVAITTLQRLAELFDRRREQLAAEVGLTVAQWQVLEEISQEHFMPSLFARQRDCTPANISKTLRQLQKKRLITVEISKSDGRQREYDLTSSGRHTMKHLRERRAHAIDRIWSGFDDSELAAFADVGGRLADRLDAYMAEGVG